MEVVCSSCRSPSRLWDAASWIDCSSDGEISISSADLPFVVSFAMSRHTQTHPPSSTLRRSSPPSPSKPVKHILTLVWSRSFLAVATTGTFVVCSNLRAKLKANAARGRSYEGPRLHYLSAGESIQARMLMWETWRVADCGSSSSVWLTRVL